LLIILSKSPAAKNYDSILEIAAKLARKGERIAVLHIQEACMATTSSEHCGRLLKNKMDVYALKADVEARGLTEKLCPDVKTIDYRQLVSLLMSDHNKTVSWTS